MNAREWLAAGGVTSARVTVLGAPISKASISPSQAWATPEAVRAALQRFPAWDAEHDTDLTALSVHDAGDVQGDRDDADASAAHARIEDAVAGIVGAGSLPLVVGGDNSLTRPAFSGAQRSAPGAWGLLTIDAHHDCRPLDGGPRNGTPVRELIERGLAGDHVAQIGIHPWGNQRDHAAWARDQGVHIVTVGEVRQRGVDRVIEDALRALLTRGVQHVYVDVDVDVVDRAFAPACPASMPGGLTPGELLQAAHRCGAHAHVHAVDITEVDALADVNDITVRLAAATLLAVCSGIASRAA